MAETDMKKVYWDLGFKWIWDTDTLTWTKCKRKDEEPEKKPKNDDFDATSWNTIRFSVWKLYRKHPRWRYLASFHDEDDNLFFDMLDKIWENDSQPTNSFDSKASGFSQDERKP